MRLSVATTRDMTGTVLVTFEAGPCLLTSSSSSADINPIGGISKTDSKNSTAWAGTNLELPILKAFLSAAPVSPAQYQSLIDSLT